MRIWAAVLVSTVAACAAEEPPPTYGDGLGTPEDPVPEDDLSYLVTSRIDLTGGGAVPAEVTETVAPLRAFAQNPAKALLASADPAKVQALRAALSSTLNSNLEGWINTEIDKARVSSKTLRQYASDVVAIAETTLTRFYLDSTLSMTPTKTTHALAGLNFRPLSVDIVVLIGGHEDDHITQHPKLTVAAGGALSLGDQTFGLAFGAHAWSGIHLASTAMYGGGVQSVLVSGINCSALAKAVAGRCVQSSCVGRESELRAICDGGSAALVGQLADRVLAVELDSVRFVAGSGRLVDDNRDGLADRILEGTWDAEMKAGTDVRQTAADFTATK